MAKISITKIFELSKYLATKSGQELRDALVYLAEFSEISIRSLRKGLTFDDNFDSETKQVSLVNGVETIISVASAKRATQVMVKRIFSDQYYVIDSFGWKYNGDGDIVVKASFAGSPAASQPIPLEVLIIF